MPVSEERHPGSEAPLDGKLWQRNLGKERQIIVRNSRPRGMPNTCEIERKTKKHSREGACADTPVIPALRKPRREDFEQAA